MQNSYCFPTKIGMLTAVSEEGFLVRLDLKGETQNATNDAVLKATEKQVNEYLSGKRRTFKLSIRPQGTAFQKKVWDALLKTSYGETVSYEDIAKNIDRPTAQRAVGNAVGRNPLLLIVPCHRVIKKNGKTGNYGAGPELKKELLQLEKAK